MAEQEVVLHNYLSRTIEVCEEDLDLWSRRSNGSQNPFAALNGGLTVKTRNCFAFAYGCAPVSNDNIRKLIGLGVRTGSEILGFLPSPGGLGGEKFSAYTQDAFTEALIRDGFDLVVCETIREIRIPKGRHLVAAYYGHAPNDKPDYHFYRLHEESRIWYHKPGWELEITPFDNAYRPIVDPRRAYRGQYDYFIGFFLSAAGAVPLQAVLTDLKGSVLLAPPERSDLIGKRCTVPKYQFA